MIGKLTGIVLEREVGSFIIEVNGGVGYVVHCLESMLANFSIGEKASLYIASVSKENEIILYGFVTKKEKDFFYLLLKVQGVGPRIALGILNQGNLSTIIENIVAQNTNFFSSIAGVGRKIALRIVSELSENKNILSYKADTTIYSQVNDSILALVSLGFDRRSVHQVVVEEAKKFNCVEEIVKASLKRLNR